MSTSVSYGILYGVKFSDMFKYIPEKEEVRLPRYGYRTGNLEGYDTYTHTLVEVLQAFGPYKVGDKVREDDIDKYLQGLRTIWNTEDESEPSLIVAECGSFFGVKSFKGGEQYSHLGENCWEYTSDLSLAREKWEKIFPGIQAGELLYVNVSN